MYENEITYTIVMTFKDAMGSVRSIKVPNARANVTGREVRKVMEQIVRDGVFLSRNGLPLVKLVRAVLVKVRWLFVAAKFSRGPVDVESTGKSDVPTGCPTTSNMSCMLVPSCGISDELFAKANAPCLRPVGADENNSCPPDKADRAAENNGGAHRTKSWPSNILYFAPRCHDLRTWRNPALQKDRGRIGIGAA